MSNKLSKKDRALYKKAQDYSKSGKNTEVLGIMEKLVKSNPDSGIFHAILANIYMNLGFTSDGERGFKKAVQISPRSEKISLGLFHCLWQLDKNDEAFEEMKRFSKVSFSQENKNIVDNINNKDV